MSIYIFEVCWFHFLLYHGCTLSSWPSKGQIKMAAIDISFLHFILKKKYISYDYININKSFLTCRNINCLNYVKNIFKACCGHLGFQNGHLFISEPRIYKNKIFVSLKVECPKSRFLVYNIVVYSTLRIVNIMSQGSQMTLTRGFKWYTYM